jgi:hypothetical protein
MVSYIAKSHYRSIMQDERTSLPRVVPLEVFGILGTNVYTPPPGTGHNEAMT